MIRLRRLAAPAVLFCALAVPPAASAASVYTGVLSESFTVSLLPDEYRYDTRPLRISFVADLSQVNVGFLMFSEDRVFEVTYDQGPGEPRGYFSDTIDLYEDYTGLLGPAGFSTVIDTFDNPSCDPYEGPAYYCEHYYPSALYLDGQTVGGPVPYTLTISAVPEPWTWVMMIVGFGATGAVVRANRRRPLEVFAEPLAGCSLHKFTCARPSFG